MRATLVRFAVVWLVGACRADGTDDGAENTGVEDSTPATELPEGVHLVDFDTTAGPFVIEVHDDWAPRGARRFLALVDDGFYDGAKFFRVLPGFVVQWGLSADPADNAEWSTIRDDPVVRSNTRRTVAFAATNLPDSRTTQVFVSLEDNTRLDDMGFAPFGRVVEGMPNVVAINAEYRDDPEQEQIRAQGNAYLDANFPNLDGIVSATVR